MDRVLDGVLKKITPTEKEKEELLNALNKIINATDKVIIPLNLDRTIAGSFIRDTWLTDKKEIDLFILFPVSCSREDLEKIGIEVGKKIIKMINGKHEIAYAEHPYVRGKFNGFSIDIVPCYRVKSASKIISAVDRTPFHNKYIGKNLKPEMSGDVRLLKQFCKAIEVYGSDVKTLGFSGYLCELLIIKYKTFKNIVSKAKKWSFGEFIDIEGHCIINNPKSHFKDQPLVVIDPTDPKRNVAAALSEKNFIKFVKTCEDFVKKPSKRFFEMDMRVLKVSEFRKYLNSRGTKMFVVWFKRPKVVDDILWSQMRKTSARLVKLLKDHEFDVFHNEVWADEKDSYFLFEMSDWSLPKRIKLKGPPVYSKKHSKQFTDKYEHQKPMVEGKIWTVEVERKYRHVKDLLNVFLERNQKTLLKVGIRSHIAKSIAKGFMIFDSKKFENKMSKNKDLSRFLIRYFEGK